MISLSDAAQHLSAREIRCRRCQRHKPLPLDRLIQECSADFIIPDLLHVLSRECSKRQAGILGDLCGIYCPKLSGLFLPRDIG